MLFPLSGNAIKMHVITISFFFPSLCPAITVPKQHFSEGSSQCNKVRKKILSIDIRKEEIKR